MSSILIACTHPSQATGYARVGYNLAVGLANRGFQVTIFGYQNVSPHAACRVLDHHPNILQIIDVAAETGQPFSFGESLLAAHLARCSYDEVILYNDVIVIQSFLDALANINISRLIVYLDLVHDDQVGVETIVQKADEIWVFSDHWKKRLVTLHAPKVKVVPHGLDPCFVSMDSTECRKALGLPLTGLIVLNTNRNSYRKALDVTIRVFLEVYARHNCPSDLYLFLNCNARCETGYDIPFLIRTECTRLNLEYEDLAARQILGMPNSGFLSDQTLCFLYNACDVGMNTCTGEGFGLPTLEHGALGKPQLATATGGLCDILGDDAIPPIEKLALCKGFIPHGGTLDIPDSKTFVERLSALYTHFAHHGKLPVYTLPCDVRKYSWASIIEKINFDTRV